MTVTSWRYPSDLTDAEWQHIGPLPPPAKRGGGRGATVDMREVVNGVMLRAEAPGCQWRYIPKDLPPRSTVHDYFSRDVDGTSEKIHYALYVKCREQDELRPTPTACIVDSQARKAWSRGEH